MHWYTNSNQCILSMIEHNIRKKINKTVTINECLTHQIISRVYDFNKNNKNFTKFSYCAMTGLLGISIIKLLFI